jgi:hypothetical protein
VPSAPAAAAEAPATLQPQPAPLTVQVSTGGVAPGLLFVGVQSLDAAYWHGPQIADNQGRPVWFRHLAGGLVATDFRVQTYRGQKVLTWWEGSANSSGEGTGTGYIADRNYRIIASVTGTSTQALDFHEFQLTPQGTALVIVPRQVPMDLSPWGGPVDGLVRDYGFREIDVATGRTIREWWALDHVSLDESYVPQLEPEWNYFHMNSVTLDTDGNVIVSSRHTKTVYKVDRRTGAVIWRLGGRTSDFTMGEGTAFSFQHDARPMGGNLYRIFDNATSLDPEIPSGPSRVVWIKADPHTGTATLLRQLVHPSGHFVQAEGSSQVTPTGTTVVGWGNASRITEFDSLGGIVFDATLPARHSTYRAFRFPWHSRPVEDPSVTVAEDGTVHAVWNGATDVVRWRVLGGSSPTRLAPLTEVAWNGLDTTLTLPDGTAPAYLKVQALDVCGRVMDSSPVTPVPQPERV